MLLDIAPGGERFLPFAKRKLAMWKAQMATAGVGSFARVILGDEGTVIYINSVALGHGRYNDRIKITGTLSATIGELLPNPVPSRSIFITYELTRTYPTVTTLTSINVFDGVSLALIASEVGTIDEIDWGTPPFLLVSEAGGASAFSYNLTDTSAHLLAASSLIAGMNSEADVNDPISIADATTLVSFVRAPVLGGVPPDSSIAYGLFDAAAALADAGNAAIVHGARTFAAKDFMSAAQVQSADRFGLSYSWGAKDTIATLLDPANVDSVVRGATVLAITDPVSAVNLAALRAHGFNTSVNALYVLYDTSANLLAHPDDVAAAIAAVASDGPGDISAKLAAAAVLLAAASVVTVDTDSAVLAGHGNLLLSQAHGVGSPLAPTWDMGRNRYVPYDVPAAINWSGGGSLDMYERTVGGTYTFNHALAFIVPDDAVTNAPLGTAPLITAPDSSRAAQWAAGLVEFKARRRAWLKANSDATISALSTGTLPPAWAAQIKGAGVLSGAATAITIIPFAPVMAGVSLGIFADATDNAGGWTEVEVYGKAVYAYNAVTDVFAFKSWTPAVTARFAAPPGEWPGYNAVVRYSNLKLSFTPVAFPFDKAVLAAV